MTTDWATDGDDAPKWRLEHSVSDKARCQQAVCKRAGTKIQKGELRIGTHQWFETDQKYIWMWRHWGCATAHQIKGLQTLSGINPENVPGYPRISAESQEQVKIALEQGSVIDKGFKDIRPDLAKFGGGAGEIRNAVGYKVDAAVRGTAGCRNATCKRQGIKIIKGELRLGIAVTFDDERISWQYKHWKCISQYDFDHAKECWKQDSLEDLEKLPEEYKATVLDSFKTGGVVKPPKLKTPITKKAKMPGVSRKKEAVEDVDNKDLVLPKPSRSGRKRRSSNEVDAVDKLGEPVSAKKRTRQSRAGVEDQEDVTS